MRLPTRRALADALDLNFATVARGYVEAQRRGRVEGRVGQGAFAADPRRRQRVQDASGRGPVDFTMNLPPEPNDPVLIARMQAGLAEVASAHPDLLRYQGFGGTEADKGWTLSAFASRGRSAGLGVVASDPFCVPGTPPEAMRVCLGGRGTRAEVSQSLEMLAHAFERAPALASSYTRLRPLGPASSSSAKVRSGLCVASHKRERRRAP